VADDRQLAVEMDASEAQRHGPEAIHAELGEVIAGTKAGRENDEQITVFGSVGLAFQDLVAGWLTRNAALELNLGRLIDLLA
jgi:ornithine cyclodeaminase